MESGANETKIIYYVDDESIPYRIKIPVDLQTITLADIKSALVRTNCKYFFKSLDADFGYGLYSCLYKYHISSNRSRVSNTSRG